MAIGQKKVTVTLPTSLLKRLNDTIPNRKRSLFITEAIKEHLDLIEQVEALEETAGSWFLENHPDMQDDKAINNWLRESRKSWG